MKLKNSILLVIITTIAISSCSTDTPQQNIARQFGSGFFVLNEGGFGKSNSNVTFIPDGIFGVENNIFTSVNPNLKKADVGQSMLINNGLVYIAFNSSNRIEIVNRTTFKSVATIEEGIKNPRYIAAANGKIYVTNWGVIDVATDDYVAVIDPNTNKVTSKISVSEGPEKIIESDGKLYVAQKGVYTTGNTITVIDSSADTISATILVGEKPNSLQIKGDELWVLCGGNKPYQKPEENTAGSIVKISKQAGRAVATIAFDDKNLLPQNLAFSSKNAYYTIDNDVYRFEFSETTLPTKALFKSLATNLYGFAIKDNRIFIADAKDFASNGDIYIHSLEEQNDNQVPGKLIFPDPIQVGLLPNGFYFDK